MSTEVNSANDLSKDELKQYLKEIESKDEKESILRQQNEKIREEFLKNQPKEEEIIPDIDVDIPTPQKVDNIKTGRMPKPGYKNIPVEYLPSKGLFYPKGTNISIRSANTKEIRHFSTIEETDSVDVDEKLFYILDNCVEVYFGNSLVSVGHLCMIDYYYIIFSIRDLTFTEGENQLSVTAECEICSTNNPNIPIIRSNLSSFKETELFMKYYDEENRRFKFNHEDLGETVFNVPTIGTFLWLKRYYRNNYDNLELDKDFLDFCPYLIKNYEKLNETTFNLLNAETMKWDNKKISLYLKLIEEYKKSSDLLIRYTCKNCGTEVTTPIYFQDGFKSLFLFTDILSGLV